MRLNRDAWDRQVDAGNQWTIPATPAAIAESRSGNVRIVLTPTREVPQEWLGELDGRDVLCLAGGGGQQAPLLAAAGANVTTLDNSPKQLEQDQIVARREGLSVRGVLGVMDDLSEFADASFDLIVHPCSNGFAPEIRPVWREAFRVLRPGGSLLSGFTNPIYYVFDDKEMEQGRLVARHKIPYSDIDSLSDVEKQELLDANEPFMFGHSLEDQIAGQLDAGFVLARFYEDKCEDEVLCRFIAPFIATCATKLR